MQNFCEKHIFAYQRRGIFCMSCRHRCAVRRSEDKNERLFDKLFGKVGIHPIVCTGFLTTVTNYCGSTYITKCIAPELQATGQNLLYCVGQALPRVLGGFVGGLMVSGLGTRGSMLLIAGITAAATLVCFVTVGRDKSPEMGPQDAISQKA